MTRERRSVVVPARKAAEPNICDNEKNCPIEGRGHDDSEPVRP